MEEVGRERQRRVAVREERRGKQGTVREDLNEEEERRRREGLPL